MYDSNKGLQNKLAIPPSVRSDLTSKKPDQRTLKQPKLRYWQRSNTNVAWVYNFDPLKKWVTIICAAILLVGSMTYLRQETVQNEQIIKAQEEAEVAKRKYLERRLEIIKQETIAAEQRKAVNQANEEMITKTARTEQRKAKIYSWTNENGQKIYSNQKPTQ